MVIRSTPPGDHRCPGPYARVLGLLLLALAAAASPARAQVITGVVVEEGTEAPVDGAMISAVDSLARTRAATLTGRDGRFRIAGLEPGRYVLRADRIGHRSSYSDTLGLAGPDTIQVRLAVRVEPIPLAGIRVEGEGRCTVRPREGEATARVWEEARKALAAAAWTRENQSYRFRVMTYMRRLDVTGRLVEEDRSEYTDTWSRKPFRSLAAGLLADRGFMEETEGGGSIWYAPDAEVLLSDAFLDTHCMNARAGQGDHGGLVGLAFRPVEGREEEEIRGTMWLDAETSELLWLEYDYVNLDLHIPTEGLGGRVEFDRVPGGGWIVRQWWIRMPVIHLRPSGQSGFTLRPVLAGYLQEGGRVLEVAERGGRVVMVTETGAIQGTVSTPEDEGGLEGARVWIPGAGSETITGEGGLFSFTELGTGAYEILWSHPRLDSLGVSSVMEEVTVRRGEVTEVELATPSTADVLEQRCRSEAAVRPAGAGVLVGRVVNPQGMPLPGAAVTIGWDDWESWVLEDERGAVAPGDSARAAAEFAGGTRLLRTGENAWRAEMVTDGQGYFLTCLVPAGHFLDLHARVGPHTTDTLRVRIPVGESHAFRTLQVQGQGTIIHVPEILRPRPDTGRVPPGR